MIAIQIAMRLIGIRQAAHAAAGGYGRRLRAGFRDDLAVWVAWLQTHPEQLTALLSLLIGEIALTRHDAGIPIIEAPTPDLPADPPVTITGDPTHAESLDRAAANLTRYPDWTITATDGHGGTATARPATAPHRPEQAPAARPDTPNPADRRTT